MGQNKALLLTLLELESNDGIIMKTVENTDLSVMKTYSRSMEPTLLTGDLLIIQTGLSGEDVCANLGNGDIIIFKNPRNPDGIPIVHRAIEKYMQDGTWYIITKGDNELTNPHPDNWYPWFPIGGNPETEWYPKAVGSQELRGRDAARCPMGS